MIARPDYVQAVEDNFARQGAMRHLGASIVRVAPGYCEVGLDFRPELAQQNGFFHAGVTSAIADTAGGYAAFSLYPEGADVLTVEYKINLIEPARGERLIACGTVLRPGRLSVARVDVFAERGGVRSVCALAQLTLMRMDPRSGSLARDRGAGGGEP